jgi:hypothetical protein
VTFASRNIITCERNIMLNAQGPFSHKEIYHARHLGPA